MFKELRSKNEKAHDRAKHRKAGGGKNWSEWHLFPIISTQISR